MPGPRRGGGDGAAARPCPECGGELVPGRVGFPLLGTPKFSYRVRTTEVTADIAATMCESCGLVTFRAADPSPVREARAALRRAAHHPPLRRGDAAPGRAAHPHPVREVYAALLGRERPRPPQDEEPGLRPATQTDNRRDQ